LLNHPTLDRLRELGLDGMAKGFRDLAANPESRALEHAEWLGLLVDQEVTLRQQRRFEARARTAKLRQAATVEDVDFRKPRGLDRTLFLHLASCLLGPPAPALPDHRRLRHRQELHRLRIGRQGLPGQPVGPLPA
jgi:DNA replication protein DnaC